MMGRRIPTSHASQCLRRNMVPNNIYLPAQLISEQAGQPTTTPNPEDAKTSSTFQHPETGNPEDHHTSSGSEHSSPASMQLLQGSEFNAPVTNWRQAVVSSCLVGAALVAVATGYACATVFRGALNVGQFVYANRDNIHRASVTCTKAVQSTYNAAKRRMVSIPVPRLPVGMRRRYSPPPSPQDRSRQRRSIWRSVNSAQPPTRSLQASNPVASILAPDGMPGVEYSGLSSDGGFPDRQDSADPDAFVYLRSPGDAAPGAPYMTGALFHEPTPPPPSPSQATEEPAPEASCEIRLRMK